MLLLPRLPPPEDDGDFSAGAAKVPGLGECSRLKVAGISRPA